jgi:hypothetical protein
MKILKTIPHETCQITLFAWNNKYLIKVEQGNLEQTYKISELDVTSQADVEEILQQTDFLKNVLTHFAAMQNNLRQAMVAIGL